MKKDDFIFMIVPGNGCAPIEDCNWYISLKFMLRDYGIPEKNIIVKSFPDAYKSRKTIWLPFIEKNLSPFMKKTEESTEETENIPENISFNKKVILIGHSSGSEAIMRLLEEDKWADQSFFGVVLAAPCVTDMGLPSETISGYYGYPWDFEKMKTKTQFLWQFSSIDDPLVPFEAEQKKVAEGFLSQQNSNTAAQEYLKHPITAAKSITSTQKFGSFNYIWKIFEEHGHFLFDEFPELFETLKSKIDSSIEND